MLLGNKIYGEAPESFRKRALDCVTWAGTRNTAVRAMLDRADIVLLIQVDAGDGDQDTVVKWKQPKTQITVTVLVDPKDAPAFKLEADLLHELILHAEPATAKHVAAVDQKLVPQYPVEDDDIEAEETVEHNDANAWYRLAELALLKDKTLFERVIADTASHGEATATTVLQRLVVAQKITAAYSEELQKDVVNL